MVFVFPKYFNILKVHPSLIRYSYKLDQEVTHMSPTTTDLVNPVTLT